MPAHGCCSEKGRAFIPSACASSATAGSPEAQTSRRYAAVRQGWNFSSAAASPISRASTLILLLPEKSLLDLGENLVQPLLGAIRSLLVISYVRFQLCDPVFGRTKFLREFLRKFDGVLTVRLGYTGGLVQQTQDTSAGAIQFIALFGATPFAAGANWITDSDS